MAGMSIVVLGSQAGSGLLHHFSTQACSPQVGHQGHALLQQPPSPLGTHQHICLHHTQSHRLCCFVDL